MPSANCYLADLNISAYTQVADDLPLGGRPLTTFFQAASRLPSGDPAIRLKLDPSRRRSLTPETNFGAGDAQLQNALAQIIKAPPVADGNNIALILADFYTGNPDAFGFMFDLDSTGPTSRPRQGCAIFLEKINTTIKAAGGGDPDFCNLVAYTAIHELGHVFNLWHEPAPPAPVSFMTPCPPANFMQACTFVTEETAYLQNAANSNSDVAKYVLPGGSNFGDRGTIGPAGGDGFLLPAPTLGLKLQIRLSHSEFWHFEPVEMDVRLSLADKRVGYAEIPDQIDPGYESCVIWITRPDGERFRYRSANHFCDNPKTRRITPQRPLERDISIFRQSGSHTFAMAGRYEIQMVVKLSAKTSLTSNVLSFEVRRAEPRLRQYAIMERLFLSNETVKLLRYKNCPPTAQHYLRLKRFAGRNQSSASACAIHYALGRALLRRAKLDADKARANRLRRQGFAHLDQAASHPAISKHRRNRIEQLRSE